MGLGESKYLSMRNIYGDIYIALTQASFVSGDILSGTIHLNLKQSYPGTTLSIRIMGKERTKIHYHHQHGSGHHRDKHRIIKEISVIHQFPGQAVLQGQYSVPFVFRMPSRLPGSISLRKGKSEATIQYSLAAFLSSKTVKPLFFKTPIYLREPLKEAIKNQSMEQRLEIDACMCCCNQGDVRLLVHFEKDAFLPGERANIIYTIENNSKENIDSIDFKLKHSVEMYTTLHSKTYKTNIQNIVLDGVRAGQKAIEKQATLKLPFCKDADFQNLPDHILAQLDDHDENMIVDSISPSVHGNLIRSFYELDVVCNLYNTCCSESPKIRFFVQIYAPTVPQKYLYEAPKDWKPEVFEPVSLAIGGGYAPPINKMEFGNDMMMAKMVDGGMPSKY